MAGEDMNDLSVDSNFFKDVVYYTTGTVSPKVLSLLSDGGARKYNYLCELITHCIAGSDAAQSSEIEEAREIYEKPDQNNRDKVRSQSSHLSSINLQDMTNVMSLLHTNGEKTQPFLMGEEDLFSKVTAYIEGVEESDKQALWAHVTFHGGKCLKAYSSKCTHLILAKPEGEAYEAAMKSEMVTVVTPDWVIVSCQEKKLSDSAIYHPKLLVFPKEPSPEPAKQESLLSTASILGFEAEEKPKYETPTQCSKSIEEKKLEELRQRMPWNLPSTPPQRPSMEISGTPRMPTPQQIPKPEQPRAGHLPQQRWSSQVAQQTQQLHPQQRYMQQRIQQQQRPQGPPLVQGQTQQWIVQESGMKHMQQPYVPRQQTMSQEASTPVSGVTHFGPGPGPGLSPGQQQNPIPTPMCDGQPQPQGHSVPSGILGPSQHVAVQPTMAPGQAPVVHAKTKTALANLLSHRLAPPHHTLGVKAVAENSAADLMTTIQHGQQQIQQAQQASHPLGMAWQSCPDLWLLALSFTLQFLITMTIHNKLFLQQPQELLDPPMHAFSPFCQQGLADSQLATYQQHSPSGQRLTLGVGPVGVPVTSTSPRMPIGPQSQPMRPVLRVQQPAIRIGIPSTNQPRSAPVHVPKVQFYGHELNIKLPPDLFLLGCVFCIIADDEFIVKNHSKICKVIAAHAGEVQEQYSPSVTHLICSYLKHPAATRALRDGKRVVSLRWLNDVMEEKTLMPPWQALHFPLPMSQGQHPLRRLVMSSTGFQGQEKRRVMQMIKALGAKYTQYFSQHNSILICKKPEGTKFKKAREWKKPVVNVAWLNELLLGHFAALNFPWNPKYQLFNNEDIFRIDYLLAPELMAPWKQPIEVTQEVLRRFKAQPPPKLLKRKRPLEQQGNIQEIASKRVKLELPPLPEEDGKPHPCVTFSCFQDAEALQSLMKKMFGLGVHVDMTGANATHLVMERVARVPKLMCALARCTYIVTKQWAEDSVAQGRLIDEAPYIVSDPVFEKKFNFSIKLVLSRPRPQRMELFKGLTFYLTPSIIPTPVQMTLIIESAGGIVKKQRSSVKKIKEMNRTGLNYIIISCLADMHMLSEVTKAHIDVFHVEFVLGAIMKQKITYDSLYYIH
ncbi:unnamed protein product [Darwinula stevensoni]|uniref:PAX-interacting protein 1 n=1 Tax=Darwinula stevensoni TaxID=69355 RepID=A0A7R8XFU1_9CRUS|nr:unnamed protein product [Darwinula stevensoni]CAG0891031.1 unnamed protein product [Darwinula stevensoni]